MKELLLPALMVSAVLMTSMGVLGRGRTDQSDLEISGTTQGNTGCAILEKHTPVKGKLLVLAVVYARTEYKVVDSFNYTMPKSKFTGQGEIEELNRLDYASGALLASGTNMPEQLDEAKRLCGE